MNILAVDDDKGFLETLCDLLGSKGHIVDTATTGGEALLKIGRDAYDVVLIDINLPDTTGVDLLRAIKNSRSPPECVMITAHQTAENAVRALNLGAEAYLTKPMEVPDLFDTIERIGEIHAAKLSETKRRQEAEEALRDAEQMALVGRVAAMMVHDLRGPLQTIRNSVLLFEMAPEKAEKARELIESAVDRTTKMLDELRNSTEKIPLRQETVNLTSMIEKTVEEAYIPNTIEMKIVCGEGLDAVIMDPSKFRRVLDNLIRNAVEAIPEGGDLSLSTENTEDGIVLELTDTGIGIPDEDTPKIFKPFFTTKPGGMGLGLAYCKRTLEAHGGTITVESEEGEGSTFRLYLPHLREVQGKLLV